MSLISDIFGGGDSQQAPDPNPGMFAAANASAANADKMFTLGEDQLAWNKDLANKELSVAAPIIRQQSDIAGQNEQQAIDQWNRYKTLFAPVEDKMVSDATNYDSPEQYDRVRQEAAGNANSAFDTAQASRDLGLEHMGVNPNSGRFVDPTAMGLQRAAGVAGAENTATANLRDKAIALRAGAASFGRNMPNTAAQAYGIADASGNSAVGNSNASTNTAVSATGTPGQYFGLSNAGYGTAGSIYGAGYSGQISAYNAANQANATMWGGLGQGFGAFAGSTAGSKALGNLWPSVFGAPVPGLARGGVVRRYGLVRKGYADGGIVRGPGTDTSDSVPAQLSDGEAVLNAPAVRLVGEDFIHSLNRAGLEREGGGRVIDLKRSEWRRAQRFGLESVGPAIQAAVLSRPDPTAWAVLP